MRFQTASATPRPVRLAPATRQWAWNSLHGLYGDDAARTPCVSLDEIDGFSSMPPLAQYDAAIRQIARRRRSGFVRRSGSAAPPPLEPPSTTPSPPPIGEPACFPASTI